MIIHACNAVVVTCIDFRFQKYIKKFTEEKLKGLKYDLVGFAGSTKSLDIVLEQIKLSKELHHIEKAILIHHEDCGAYGVESTKERHAKDLKKAKQVLNALYPSLEVDLYYLHLDGKFDVIQ